MRPWLGYFSGFFLLRMLPGLYFNNAEGLYQREALIEAQREAPAE